MKRGLIWGSNDVSLAYRRAPPVFREGNGAAEIGVNRAVSQCV